MNPEKSYVHELVIQDELFLVILNTDKTSQEIAHPVLPIHIHVTDFKNIVK
jgi:hypothetical protein